MICPQTGAKEIIAKAFFQPREVEEISRMKLKYEWLAGLGCCKPDPSIIVGSFEIV